MANILAILGLDRLRHRRVSTLSGGEKQKLALAVALSRHPEILVLDEPTSQLDPRSAHDVLQKLFELHMQNNLTVVLAEHRLERCIPYANRMIHLDRDTGGVFSGTTEEVLAQSNLTPPLVTLAKRTHAKPLIFTPSNIPSRLKELAASCRPFVTKPTRSPAGNGFAIELGEVGVAIGSRWLLQEISLTFHGGEVSAILGMNGAGKTTLLRVILGLAKPTRGQVRLHQGAKEIPVTSPQTNLLGYLPQDPNSVLFAESVFDEIQFTLENHKLHWSRLELTTHLEMFGLVGLGNAYPRDLSVGQRERVAAAAVTANNPVCLLLDEPTRGLDYRAKSHLAGLLVALRDEGKCIIVVTHDVEFAARIADRVAILDDGRIASHGTPKSVLRQVTDFAPQIALAFPHTSWLTVEDALEDLSDQLSNSGFNTDMTA